MSWQVINADQLQGYYNNQQQQPYPSSLQPAQTAHTQPQIIQLKLPESTNPQQQHQSSQYNYQPVNTSQLQPQIIQLTLPKPNNPQQQQYNCQHVNTTNPILPQIIQLKLPEQTNQQNPHQHQQQAQHHPQQLQHHQPACPNRQANPWDMNPHPGTEPNIVWPMNQNPFMTQGGSAPWPNYNQQSLVPQFMAGHGLPGNHMSNQPTAGPQVYTNWYQGGNTASDNSYNSAENISNSNISNPFQYNLNRNQNSETATVCQCCGHTNNPRALSGYNNMNGNRFNQSQVSSCNNSTTGGHICSYNSTATMQRNPNNNQASHVPTNPYMDNYIKQLTQMGLQSNYQQAISGGQNTQSQSLSGCCPPYPRCDINQIPVPPLPVPPPTQQQILSNKLNKSSKSKSQSPQQKLNKTAADKPQAHYHIQPPDLVNNAYLMSMENMREMHQRLLQARARAAPLQPPQPPAMACSQFQKAGQRNSRGGSATSAASSGWNTETSSFHTE